MRIEGIDEYLPNKINSSEVYLSIYLDYLQHHLMINGFMPKVFAGRGAAMCYYSLNL